MIRQRRRDQGISLILVVVLVLIAIILNVAAVILWANFKEKERLKAALLAEEKRLQQEQLDLEDQRTKVLAPTGLKAGEGTSDLPVSAAHERLKKIKAEYVSAARFGTLPIDKPTPILKPEDFDAKRDGTVLYNTLQDLVPLAAAWTNHYKNRYEQLLLELDIAKEQTKNRVAVRPDISKRRAEYRTELEARIKDVSDQTSKAIEAHNARKELLNTARAEAEKQIAEETERFAGYDIKINNEIRELRRQMEELKVKEVIKHDVTLVHGKVLKPDIPNKMGFIDIGSRDRVVPGLRFMVGQFGVQGKFEPKGKIEVKKAWTMTSEVSIVEVYNPREKPIVEGDLLINPLFSRERAIVVAFAGEEKPIRVRPQYSVDEATRRIREIGSVVKKEIDREVDFVIFTELGSGRTHDQYEAWKKAVFLELPIATAGRNPEEADRPGVFEFLGD